MTIFVPLSPTSLTARYLQGVGSINTGLPEKAFNGSEAVFNYYYYTISTFGGNNDEYHIAIEPSGMAPANQKTLFLVQEQISSIYVNPTPPPNTLSVHGQALTPDSPGSNLGDVLINDSATKRIDVTPLGAINIRFPTAVTVPKLQIIDKTTGIVLSGQTNTVIVGQQMSLECQLSITNAVLNDSMLTNFQWTVPGFAISNYWATNQIGIVYTNFQTTNSSTMFCWVDGASNRILKCSATIDGVTIANQAVFNVLRPTGMITSITGPVLLDTNWEGDAILALHYGIIDEGVVPGILGIYFTNTVILPNSYTGNTNFSVEWVQIITNTVTALLETNGALYKKHGDECFGYALSISK